MAHGTGLCTLGFVNNTTGTPIAYHDMKCWSGHFVNSLEPRDFTNGTWGYFLHENLDSTGSSAGVLYKCQNASGKFDWLLAWSNPSDPEVASKVYTRILDPVEPTNEFWNTKKAELRNDGRPTSEHSWNGLTSTLTIVGDSFQAKITVSQTA